MWQQVLCGMEYGGYTSVATTDKTILKNGL